MSILLQATNDVLSTCAAATNKYIKLGKEFKPRPVAYPEVTSAQATVFRLSKHLKSLESSGSTTPAQLQEAKQAVVSARITCRRVTNAVNREVGIERDKLPTSP